MERPEFYVKNSSWCIHLKGAKKVTRTQEDNFAAVPNTIKTSNVIKTREWETLVNKGKWKKPKICVK